MQPAVTLVTLYPPIAAATVVNVFLFAGMWRGYQTERKTGKTSSWLALAFISYTAVIGIYAYLFADRAATDWPTVFAAAIVGEAAGGVVVCTTLNALVFTRGRPRGERVSAFIQSAVLTLIAFAGLFAGK